jgi:hypothetical protein
LQDGVEAEQDHHPRQRDGDHVGIVDAGRQLGVSRPCRARAPRAREPPW